MLSHKIWSEEKQSKALYIKWFVAGFLVGSLLILGFLIRQSNESSFSYIDGYFSPNVQYGPWYLANHYRLFSTIGGIPVISNYTSGLDYGAVDFTHTFLTGAAFILAKETDVERISFLYRITPWQGILLVPLAILAIYCRLVRAYHQSVNPWHVVLLYALTSFSNYPMIVWSISGGFSSPLGWIFFYAIFLFILSNNLDAGNSVRWTFLLMMTMILVQPTYHTMALALLVIIWVTWLIPKFFKIQFISFTVVLITSIAFLTFLMFHAIPILQSYGQLLGRFLNDIYRSYDNELIKYSLKILDVSLWWHAANYGAILVPVIWTVFIYGKRKFLSSTEYSVVLLQITALLALIPLAILFFAWGGVYSAYERLLQYGTLLAIINAAFLLVSRPKAVFPLAISTIICLFVSVFLTNTFEVVTASVITNDEKASIEWITQNHLCDQVVMTDYRVGSTFGYWGCFSVIGPTATSLFVQGEGEEITSLLYDSDPEKLERALENLRTVQGKSPNVILLSQRFLNPRIGFILPDTRMKPLTKEQWETYRHLEKWRITYENATTMVLIRN